MSKSNKWTRERLETSVTSEVMLEHLHRYVLALEFTTEKKVLDIACGEGYGSNMMAKVAQEVIGIDNEKNIVNRAAQKYTGKNLQFIHGSILDIPADDRSFDLITCFETLEHISDHDTAISELKRVLSPSGLLMISTPEKRNYSDKTGYKNPFHKKELYENEFKTLLEKNFKEVKLLGQYSCAQSVVCSPDQAKIENYYSGDYNSVKTTSGPEIVYWIAMASDNPLPHVNNSSFLHSFSISDLLQKESEAVKKTLTYRIGHFILYPFKCLKALFSR